MLESLISEVDTMSSRVERLEAASQEQNAIEMRLDAIEGLCRNKEGLSAALSGQIHNIETRFEKLESALVQKMDGLEKGVGDKMAEMKRDMQSHVGEMDGKLDEKLKMLEEVADGLRGRMDGVRWEIIDAVALL